MNAEELFWLLYNAPNEDEVDDILRKHPDVFDPSNWTPLGNLDNNFGVVENQQSNPVAALVEKITNSIDAILMRKCLEANIDPRSEQAPRSIQEAITRFFPEARDWNLGRGEVSQKLRSQAESIQILRDGDSLLIYDDGEGQHPEEFERTFLSLLRGNKNDIHFVQGKYNMGGSGAIIFCGKRRYQLIASKRFDGSGSFGFTLIRQHPLSSEERRTVKNTWYEYLKINGEIPAFPIREIDLRLFRRKFRTGTVIKLYSYELKGNKDVSRDLGRSVQEFLYSPALPFYMVQDRDSKTQHTAHRVIYGLQNRLNEDNEFIEATFSENYEDAEIGKMRATVHVFRAKAGTRGTKDTRAAIQSNYFKNNMVVLFSVNGQVHGHYTAEFITRTLKYNLLSGYLLIHVDCTEMNIEFRNELFMASRDRLKQGEESSTLRGVLAKGLQDGKLDDIYKRRKAAVSVEDAEDDEILRGFAQKLPIRDDLRQLLDQTFKLKETAEKPKRAVASANERAKPDPKPFHPKRYPTFFKLDAKSQGDHTVLAVPLGGSKTVRFETDVEDQYFDRTEDPGDMQIAVMDYVPNDSSGGDRKGTVNKITDVFSISRKSPTDGTIKLVLSPTADVQVGDEVQLRVDLKNPAGEDFTEVLWVRITEPPAESKEKPASEPDQLGLPLLVRVYKETPEGSTQAVKTWAELESIEMDYDTVMYPLVEGEVLQTIYINLDSHVLRSYKGKIRNPSTEQVQLADRRYITAVYFHTIFLYVISKNRRYNIVQRGEQEEKKVDLADYLRDVFNSHYAAFLMNFETGQLLDAIS